LFQAKPKDWIVLGRGEGWVQVDVCENFTKAEECIKNIDEEHSTDDYDNEILIFNEGKEHSYSKETIFKIGGISGIINDFKR
jgi:hypothetical protein